jgi:hypothetical protein
VDSDPELNPPVGQIEDRFSRSRRSARGKRDPERTRALVHAPSRGGDPGHVLAPICGSSGDLLDEHGCAHSATPSGVERVLDRDVVVDEHGLHGDALVGCIFGGELEVHHVARVVLDDVHDSGAAIHRLRGREHLIGYR